MKDQLIEPNSAFDMTDPEWIALESVEERTRRFIFDDSVLRVLRLRGLVEPQGNHWRVTHNGLIALRARDDCSQSHIVRQSASPRHLP